VPGRRAQLGANTSVPSEEGDGIGVFAELARGIGEPLLLLSGGRVSALNPAAEEVVGPGSVGGDLVSLMRDPVERIQGYLRIWSRSLQPAPGALTPRKDPAQSFACEGWRVRVGPGANWVVLRLLPKAARIRPFMTLTERVQALTSEILRRQAVEQQLRQSQGELSERLLEIDQANRLKDEFLATLSHELRTPLNAILGWVQLLQNTRMDAEGQARALETIARNARQQAQLVSDILDISRITAGKLRISLASIDLVQVITEAIATVHPAALAKEIEISTVLDSRPAIVLGDAERLQQVLWNLLSNAVKFTPKHGRVRVVLVRVNSHVELSVEDNGPGIPQDFLAYVFDKFRQADASSRRLHGGMGLGLSIVRSLIELHGGSVRAANREVGTGAVFTIALPRQSVVAHSAPASLAPAQVGGRAAGIQPVSTLQGCKVLVVDDDTDGRELVRRVLELAGANVLAFASAEEALPALMRHRPDIIVSDIEMPITDGYAFLRQVRALSEQAGGTTPAIALTAYAGADDRMKALRAGFQNYLAKPVQTAELITVVASVLGKLGPDRDAGD
jgi:signal transduction histidine kinase/ActR/RegA family two-component response regulator